MAIWVLPVVVSFWAIDFIADDTQGVRLGAEKLSRRGRFEVDWSIPLHWRANRKHSGFCPQERTAPAVAVQIAGPGDSLYICRSRDPIPFQPIIKEFP